MRLRQSLLPLIALALLCSCPAEKPDVPSAKKDAVGGPPSAEGLSALKIPGDITFEISPRDPSRKSFLSVMAKGFDLSRANLQWLVNGSPAAAETTGQFNCSGASKGSTVQAQAMVQGREVLSNIVEIRNTRPELVSVRFMPETFRPGDVLMVEAESRDIDDDPVTLLYNWTRNGTPAGSSSKITGEIKRGDRVTVTVTPYDGQQYGTPVILNTEVRNLPPAFIEHKDFTFTGSRYTYHAQAVDPDGDVLTYSLTDAPDGMTIDRSTGVLSWNVPQDFKGEKGVIITADDGHGGSAQYPIVVSISP